MQFAIVVAVLNEAGNILPQLEEIDAALGSDFDYEIVYLDDGSTDETPAELAAAKKKFKRLRVITHETRGGKSRALISAIQRVKAPWVITFDGDRQNDPADIPRLWAALQKDGAPDPNLVLCGHRTERIVSPGKKIASRFANRLRRWILKDDTPDTACGIKVFRRDDFLELPRFENMHRFFPALFKARGRTIKSVPVKDRDRTTGKSKYGILDRGWQSFWDLLGVIWLLGRTKYPAIRED